MKTCFFRNLPKEHFGIHRESDILYAMKGFDEASQGLAYVLEGNWGGFTDHSSDFGCRFGFNSFLDYGAELMCLEFTPIHEVWALSGLAERKTADADWKAVFSEQQVSLYNSSTCLVSNNPFEGTVFKGDGAKNEIKGANDPSVLCVATDTGLCPHIRRSRPKRVSMTPLVDSMAASSAFQKDSLVFCAAKGLTCANSLLNRDWVEVSQGVPSRLVSPCCPPWTEKLCLASLPCHEKMRPCEKDLLDIMESGTTFTDVISPESHVGVNKSSLFETSPSNINQLICEKEDLTATHKGRFDVSEKDVEMVGKALCYAQTRARLAEKLTEQTLKERDKLEQLLIRETWTSHTYRQRALSLEIENRLLKLCSKQGSQLWSNKEKAHSCESGEPKTLSHLSEKQPPSLNSRGQHGCTPSHTKKSNTKKGVSLSSALGFAFVLGLSIAGTGIVIVWTVSWMLFS